MFTARCSEINNSNELLFSTFVMFDGS